jgi:hypothetical protein
MNKVRVSPFGVIVNNSGSVVEHFSVDCVIEEILAGCERLSREFKSDSPHIPLVWEGEGWRDLREVIREANSGV